MFEGWGDTFFLFDDLLLPERLSSAYNSYSKSSLFISKFASIISPTFCWVFSAVLIVLFGGSSTSVIRKSHLHKYCFKLFNFIFCNILSFAAINVKDCAHCSICSGFLNPLVNFVIFCLEHLTFLGAL